MKRGDFDFVDKLGVGWVVIGSIPTLLIIWAASYRIWPGFLVLATIHLMGCGFILRGWLRLPVGWLKLWMEERAAVRLIEAKLRSRQRVAETLIKRHSKP